MTSSNRIFQRIYDRAPIVAGGLTAVLGLLSLVGWIVGAPLLASFSSDFIPMAPSTALLFGLLGGSMVLWNRFPQNRTVYRLVLAAGSFAILTAVVLLCLSYLHVQLQAEELGLSSGGTLGSVPLGHMAPLTAFCFLLCSAALLLLLLPLNGALWRTRTAFGLAFVCFLISLSLLVAYQLGTPFYYGSDTIPPAISTAMAFLTLAVSICFTVGLTLTPSNKKIGDSPAHEAPVLILAFVLFSAGILAAGYFYYRSYEKTYLTQIGHQLSAIADLKAGNLAQWRDQQMAAAKELHGNPMLTTLIQDCFQRGNTRNRALLRDWLDRMRKNSQYNAIQVLDRRGVRRFSSPDSLIPLADVVLRAMVRSARTNTIELLDFYRNELDGHIYLAIVVPVYEEMRGTARTFGAIVVRIDPTRYLYPLVERWPIPSRTAESLILRIDRHDVVFLNPLRFRKDAALRQRIPLSRGDVPAVMAAKGKEGIVEGLDYRGVHVLADVRPVPGSPWFLVARMDLDEVYAPLANTLWITVALVVSILLAGGIGVGFNWRNQHTRFYRERYEAARTLAASETRYRRLFESAKDGILILDGETGEVIDVNPFLQELLAVVRGDLIGRQVWNLPFFRGVVGSRSDFDQWRGQDFLQRQDLTIESSERLGIEVEFISSKYLVDNRTIVQCTLRDLSKRKEIERESAFLSTIVRTTDDAIIGETSDGVILSWNAGAERMYGYRPSEIVGRSIAILTPADHKNKLFQMLQQFQQGGGTRHLEAVTARKNGDLIDVSLTLSSIVDKEGTLVGVSIIARDITDRKRTERELIELNAQLEARVRERTAQLEASNKELEAFSYSVSHDLKTPLRAIDGFSRVLLEEYAATLDDEGKRLLNIVSSSAQRMGELITDLLDLARITRDEMVVSRVEMQPLVRSVYEEIAPAEDVSHISFRVSLLPDAQGDPALVKQVWQNLISNAIKFTSRSEIRLIEVQSRQEKGGMIAYSIRDTGAGFDPQYGHKLFGVFQRLHKKEEFAGTGVGLAIVDRIVRRHGGRVWAEGKPGEGAVFHFTLPSIEDPHGQQ